MILHVLRLRRNVNRNVFNDRKKYKRYNAANSFRCASVGASLCARSLTFVAPFATPAAMTLAEVAGVAATVDATVPLTQRCKHNGCRHGNGRDRHGNMYMSLLWN